MSNPNTRKSCVVPKCKNTTTNSPEKLFFIVPKDVKMRKKWLKAMKRLDPFGDKSTVYCCEDHFDIENDMENYTKYKLVGGRIKLKLGKVPHKFKCQQEKEDKPQRSAMEKRNRIEFIEKLLNKDETSALEKPEEILVASCGDEIVIEDTLSFGNNDQCLEISKKSKGVQVNLKAKGVHKSTMTVNKYLKKKRKLIFSPHAVSFGSMNDTSHFCCNLYQRKTMSSKDNKHNLTFLPYKFIKKHKYSLLKKYEGNL